MGKNTNIHELIPTHEKLDDAQKKSFLEEMKISSRELPKILKDDPALADLGVKAGDVIKIYRLSATSGTTSFYRVVIDG